VKQECKNPDGLLQLIDIPQWKWEVISMYCITTLPKRVKQHYSIMVIVDMLTKVTHFVLAKFMFLASDMA